MTTPRKVSEGAGGCLRPMRSVVRCCRSRELRGRVLELDRIGNFHESVRHLPLWFVRRHTRTLLLCLVLSRVLVLWTWAGELPRVPLMCFWLPLLTFGSYSSLWLHRTPCP